MGVSVGHDHSRVFLRKTRSTTYLTKNLDYRGHLSTFRAENIPKSGHFKFKNNAQTLTKQHQNNFEKVQKMTFSTPKWSKMTLQIHQYDQNFDRKSQLSGSFIDLAS